MQYNQSDLDKVKEYASLLLTISEIAILLKMDEDELREAIAVKTSGISLAYNQGKMETVLVLRRQEIDLAKLGSPIAIELTQKYMLNQNLNENV
ncbi:MAG: hypothetical protein ACOYN4_05555 [Bacteroidales bacterium]